MVRDLKDLMGDALPQHVGEPDLDTIERRVARRHTARLVGAAAGVLGAVALGVGVLASISGPEAPVIDEPPTPTVEETSAATEAPTDASEQETPGTSVVGGPFTLETMPMMAEEGVAVDTGAGIAFVGLDGTLFGTLTGYELAFDLPPSTTPGLALVRRTGESGSGIWLAPDDATTYPYALGVPLWGQLMTAGNEPGTWLLQDFDGETRLVSDTAGWWLSADHRSITWVDPDGVRQHLDFDMGGYGTRDDGCYSVDEFADFNGIQLCATADASWLDVWSAGSPDGPRRIEAPALDGDRWVFERAFFGGPGVVAMLTDADGHRAAVVGFTLEGEQVAILPDELDTTATSLLGVDRGGSAIVQAPFVDRGDGADQPGGLYVIDRTTGDARRIWEDGSRGAQVWTGWIDLAAIAGVGDATPPPSGRLVRITAVDVDRRRVTVDEQRWLSGEEARAAYEEETGDPSGPPNDYLLQDVDGLEGDLEVVDGAQVLVPGDLPETVPGGLSDIATWIDRVGPFLAWVEEAEPGRLGSIRWQYTP